MQDTRFRFSRPLTIEKAMRVGVVLTFGLLLFGAWRFPESVARGALLSPIGTCLVLLAYAVAAAWACRATSDSVQTALGVGSKTGVLVGTLAVINHWIEIFSGLRAPVPAILGVGMWGLMFFCFGGVSSATYKKVGSIGPGIIASMWSAMVSAIATVLFATSVGLIFMPHVQLIFAGDFKASGMVDSRAFVVRNLFDGAFTHLFLAPCLAAVVGAASALVFVTLRSLSRRTVVVLGVAGVLLLFSGIASIRYASSLDRSARPPFITFGLMALCAALASAYPIAIMLRRSNSNMQPAPHR